MREITALISSMVVIGKKNLKPGRPITMSPGRRNSGTCRNHDQPGPRITRLTPSATSTRFMGSECMPLGWLAVRLMLRADTPPGFQQHIHRLGAVVPVVE